MANDWGRPFTPEELEKLAAKPTGDELHYTGPNLAFEVPPSDPTPATLDSTPEELAAKGWVQTAHDEWEKIAPDTSPFAGAKMTITRDPWPEPVKPDLHDNPTCHAWHPESGCGIIFSDRDALNEALEAEPLLVEMTKEEYDEATKVHAADWGKPVNSVGSYYAPDGTLMNADGTRSVFDDVDAFDGDPLTPDEPEHPDCTTPYAERTAPVETYSEADGPWYVVYFGPVLYTVLAGPYETEEAAAGRLDIVWGQFEHDAAYDFTFPVRERSGLRAATVRTVYNLKGAYGKQ